METSNYSNIQYFKPARLSEAGDWSHILPPEENWQMIGVEKDPHNVRFTYRRENSLLENRCQAIWEAVTGFIPNLLDADWRLYIDGLWWGHEYTHIILLKTSPENVEHIQKINQIAGEYLDDYRDSLQHLITVQPSSPVEKPKVSLHLPNSVSEFFHFLGNSSDIFKITFEETKTWQNKLNDFLNCQYPDDQKFRLLKNFSSLLSPEDTPQNTFRLFNIIVNFVITYESKDQSLCILHINHYLLSQQSIIGDIEQRCLLLSNFLELTLSKNSSLAIFCDIKGRDSPEQTLEISNLFVSIAKEDQYERFFSYFNHFRFHPSLVSAHSKLSAYKAILENLPLNYSFSHDCIATVARIHSISVCEDEPSVPIVVLFLYACAFCSDDEPIDEIIKIYQLLMSTLPRDCRKIYPYTFFETYNACHRISRNQDKISKARIIEKITSFSFFNTEKLESFNPITIDEIEARFKLIDAFENIVSAINPYILTVENLKMDHYREVIDKIPLDERERIVTIVDSIYETINPDGIIRYSWMSLMNIVANILPEERSEYLPVLLKLCTIKQADAHPLSSLEVNDKTEKNLFGSYLHLLWKINNELIKHVPQHLITINHFIHSNTISTSLRDRSPTEKKENFDLIIHFFHALPHFIKKLPQFKDIHLFLAIIWNTPLHDLAEATELAIKNQYGKNIFDGRSIFDAVGTPKRCLLHLKGYDLWQSLFYNKPLPCSFDSIYAYKKQIGVIIKHVKDDAAAIQLIKNMIVNLSLGIGTYSLYFFLKLLKSGFKLPFKDLQRLVNAIECSKVHFSIIQELFPNGLQTIQPLENFLHSNGFLTFFHLAIIGKIFYHSKNEASKLAFLKEDIKKIETLLYALSLRNEVLEYFPVTHADDLQLRIDYLFTLAQFPHDQQLATLEFLKQNNFQEGSLKEKQALLSQRKLSRPEISYSPISYPEKRFSQYPEDEQFYITLLIHEIFPNIFEKVWLDAYRPADVILPLLILRSINFVTFKDPAKKETFLFNIYDQIMLTIRRTPEYTDRAFSILTIPHDILQDVFLDSNDDPEMILEYLAIYHKHPKKFYVLNNLRKLYQDTYQIIVPLNTLVKVSNDKTEKIAIHTPHDKIDVVISQLNDYFAHFSIGNGKMLPENVLSEHFKCIATSLKFDDPFKAIKLTNLLFRKYNPQTFAFHSKENVHEYFCSLTIFLSKDVKNYALIENYIRYISSQANEENHVLDNLYHQILLADTDLSDSSKEFLHLILHQTPKDNVYTPIFLLWLIITFSNFSEREQAYAYSFAKLWYEKAQDPFGLPIALEKLMSSPNILNLPPELAFSIFNFNK